MTDTENEITADLITELLREQHPDLADLPLTFGARGWDNQLWRLGDDLAVRLPWACNASPRLDPSSRENSPTTLNADLTVVADSTAEVILATGRQGSSRLSRLMGWDPVQQCHSFFLARCRLACPAAR